MISWSETDIEDYIVEHFSCEFNCYYIGRQINIGVGKVDILGYDLDEKSLVVVEIKKGAIDENAIGQLMRYMAGINDYIEDIVEKHKLQINSVVGILVGTNITDTAITALRFVQDNITYYEYQVKLNINLTSHCYGRNKESLTYKPDEFYSIIKETVESALQEEKDLEEYHADLEKTKEVD